MIVFALALAAAASNYVDPEIVAASGDTRRTHKALVHRAVRHPVAMDSDVVALDGSDIKPRPRKPAKRAPLRIPYLEGRR